MSRSAYRWATPVVVLAPMAALLWGCSPAARPTPTHPAGVETGPRPTPRAEAGDRGGPSRPRPQPQLNKAPAVILDPSATISMLWAAAATDATVAGSTVIALEPTGDHLDAARISDGASRWRIEIPPTERASLTAIGNRVFVHDGDRVIVVEAEHGRVLAEQPARPAHRAVSIGGACAWSGRCGLQPFDCDDGAPIGPYLASTETHWYGLSDDPTEHGTSCEPYPRLLGSTGDRVLVIAGLPDPDSDAPSLPRTLAGLDPTDGTVKWQRPLPAGGQVIGPTSAGDGWIVDSIEGQLTAFDARSGDVRWQRPLGPGRLVAQAFERELVVAREHGGRWRITGYGSDRPVARWSTRTGRRQFPLIAGAPIEQANVTEERRVFAIVDRAAGEIAGQLVAGRGARLWHDPPTGFLLTGHDLREHGPAGDLLRQRPLRAADVEWVTPDYLLSREGDTLIVHDRTTLREHARLVGLRLQLDPALPPTRALLRRDGDDGAAVLLALDPPSLAGGE